MSGGRFRVTACPAADKGLRLVMEFCDDRKDADELYRGLQAEDTILAGCGYGAVVIALDEMCNGEWTNASTKLVIIGGE